MSERRRLKAGVEVEVFPSGWGYVDKRWDWGMSPSQVHALTEPIPDDPDDPAGPKVGDMADDIQRLHHAVHVELEDRIEALEEESGVVGERLRKLERMAHWDSPTNPNPKEVMPDAGAGDPTPTPDVAPPPGAEQDAPGGEEPPTLKSFWGVAPNATGGVSSVEFVRALRDEGGEEPSVMSTSGDGIVFTDDMDDIAVGDEPSVEDVLEWLDCAYGHEGRQAAMETAAARIIREQREEIEEWANLYRRLADWFAHVVCETRAESEAPID